MDNWVTWAGVIGTFLFGGISVWQLFQNLVDRKVRDANKKHILAMKNSLQAVRQMCAEAIETQEVIKTEAVRQWVRQVAWTLVGVEHHIDAMLEIEQMKPEQNDSTKQRQRKLVNSWIAEAK